MYKWCTVQYSTVLNTCSSIVYTCINNVNNYMYNDIERMEYVEQEF